jgi:hypothetical protein
VRGPWGGSRGCGPCHTNPAATPAGVAADRHRSGGATRPRVAPRTGPDTADVRAGSRRALVLAPPRSPPWDHAHRAASAGHDRAPNLWRRRGALAWVSWRQSRRWGPLAHVPDAKRAALARGHLVTSLESILSLYLYRGRTRSLDRLEGYRVEALPPLVPLRIAKRHIPGAESTSLLSTSYPRFPKTFVRRDSCVYPPLFPPYFRPTWVRTVPESSRAACTAMPAPTRRLRRAEASPHRCRRTSQLTSESAEPATGTLQQTAESYEKGQSTCEE